MTNLNETTKTKNEIFTELFGTTFTDEEKNEQIFYANLIEEDFDTLIEALKNEEDADEKRILNNAITFKIQKEDTDYDTLLLISEKLNEIKEEEKLEKFYYVKPFIERYGDGTQSLHYKMDDCGGYINEIEVSNLDDVKVIYTHEIDDEKYTLENYIFDKENGIPVIFLK